MWRTEDEDGTDTEGDINAGISGGGSQVGGDSRRAFSRAGSQEAFCAEEQPGQLGGASRGGKLPGFLEDRIGSSPTFRHLPTGQTGDHRVHRNLLQPDATAGTSWLSVTRRFQSAVLCKSDGRLIRWALACQLASVSLAMHRLNHRPRKCLSFKTPHEVFMEQLHSQHTLGAL